MKIFKTCCELLRCDGVSIRDLPKFKREKYHGQYDPSSICILVDPTLDIVETTKTILHELTHFLQDEREDFDDHWLLGYSEDRSNPYEREAIRNERLWKRALMLTKC